MRGPGFGRRKSGGARFELKDTHLTVQTLATCKPSPCRVRRCDNRLHNGRAASALHSRIKGFCFTELPRNVRFSDAARRKSGLLVSYRFRIPTTLRHSLPLPSGCQFALDLTHLIIFRNLFDEFLNLQPSHNVLDTFDPVLGSVINALEGSASIIFDVKFRRIVRSSGTYLPSR